MSTDIAGRRWAYLGAAFGAVVSIAANIAHSFVPPHGAGEAWTPNAGAVIGAVFWPVALFVATEILTRVAWPNGWTWHLLRWAGMLPVAAVAALVSYRHLSGLLAFYGEEPLVCVLGPLAVDGLMVMATGAILATGHPTTDTTPAHVPVSVLAAPGSTIAARPAPTPTVHPSTVDTPTRVPVDAIPEPEPTSADAGRVVPSPAVVATRITGADATSPAGSATALRGTNRKPSPRPSTPGDTPVGKLAAPATDTPVTEPEPAQLALPIVAPELLKRADQVARQFRTEHGQPITAGQLAVRLKVTSDQATHALAVLNLSTDSPTTPIPTVNGHRPVKANSR